MVDVQSGLNMIESIRFTSTVTDQWREIYNHQRPHQAPDFNVPASRYRQSELCYQEVPAELEYGDDDEVRTVQANGELNW